MRRRPSGKSWPSLLLRLVPGCYENLVRLRSVAGWQSQRRDRGGSVVVRARSVILAAVPLLAWLVAVAPPAEAFGSSDPPPLPSVSAGGYMTCAVQADGSAACWGENAVPSNDQLNVGPGGAATPPAGVRFLEVNAGYATACGITTDRAIVCWGNDRFNKLQEPAGTFTHVAPGLNYICALRTDGTIVCWGGDDPAAPGADPLQRVVRDVPTGQFTQVSVGIRHACALRADGTIVCWGHNADGQTNVPPGTYSHVNVGNFTSCALRTDGTPVCWGRNQGGQQTYPAGTFTELSVGFAHVCGLRPGGTLTCWGRSAEGQTTAPAGTYTHVSAGTFHSCAMPASGPPAVCWGNNQAGRVQPSMSNTPPPATVATSSYSFQLTMVTHVSPAPTYSLVSGQLPPGVTLSPTGLLSGTPTAPGTYTFTVQAVSNGLSPPGCVGPVTGSLPCIPGDTSSVATATRTFTITVGAGCGGRAATIEGTEDADELVGTEGDDVISGLGGDDHISGLGGNDIVCGDAGDDMINAGSGDDQVFGGSGDDKLRGGSGDDTLSGDDGSDHVVGGGGADVLSGGSGAPDHCVGSGKTGTLGPNHGCEKINRGP